MSAATGGIAVRPAQPADLDQLTHLAARFCRESGLGLSFDRERARATLWRAIHDPEEVALVAERDGLILGGVQLRFEAEWTRETLGYVVKFIVEPEARGTAAARALAAAAVETARARGAAHLFAAATADMGPRVEALFVRLFEKQGFRPLGRFLVRAV